jgi:hypothetical protein
MYPYIFQLGFVMLVYFFRVIFLGLGVQFFFCKI